MHDPTENHRVDDALTVKRDRVLAEREKLLLLIEENSEDRAGGANGG